MSGVDCLVCDSEYRLKNPMLKKRLISSEVEKSGLNERIAKLSRNVASLSAENRELQKRLAAASASTKMEWTDADIKKAADDPVLKKKLEDAFYESLLRGDSL